MAGTNMTDQYIITGEQIRAIAYDGISTAGLKNKRDALKAVKSHPYNPQADDIDEWCKLHEEVLKDIRIEAYRSGYQDGEKSVRGKKK